MATFQTVQHFKKYSDTYSGPCLEIGSLIHPSYRQHLPKEMHGNKLPGDYTGIDIFPGEGVDYIVNLCKDEDIKKLPFSKYKTIHCHYVMEHVTDIFTMARNMESLLDVGGVLLFSVPFSWRIHRIPVDMWRFTPQSIDYLFPNVEFLNDKCRASLRHGNETFDISNGMPEFGLDSGINKYPGYIKWYAKILKKLGLHNNIFNQRAFLYESNLMMYGIKREQPTYTYFNQKYL